MPEPSDREILIEVRTTVVGLRTELLGGEGREGRIPKLEDAHESHAEQINQFVGGLGTIKWVVGAIGATLLALGTAVLAHMLGGGK